MAQLTVRNVPDDIADALKARAAAAGRSAEAEHRRILQEVLSGPVEDDFFAAAKRSRIRLRQPGPSTTEMLREDRERGAGE